MKKAWKEKLGALWLYLKKIKVKGLKTVSLVQSTAHSRDMISSEQPKASHLNTNPWIVKVVHKQQFLQCITARGKECLYNDDEHMQKFMFLMGAYNLSSNLSLWKSDIWRTLLSASHIVTQSFDSSLVISVCYFTLKISISVNEKFNQKIPCSQYWNFKEIMRVGFCICFRIIEGVLNICPFKQLHWINFTRGHHQFPLKPFNIYFIHWVPPSILYSKYRKNLNIFVGLQVTMSLQVTNIIPQFVKLKKIVKNFEKFKRPYRHITWYCQKLLKFKSFNYLTNQLLLYVHLNFGWIRATHLDKLKLSGCRFNTNIQVITCKLQHEVQRADLWWNFLIVHASSSKRLSKWQ